jgi:hypothetical protein
MIESRSKEQLPMKSTDNTNADIAARKAAMQERARMAIEGRGYKVRYDRTADGAECGSRAVSAQKKASLVEIDQDVVSAASAPAGAMTRKLLIQCRSKLAGNGHDRPWMDLDERHTGERLCGVEAMRDWVRRAGDRQFRHRIIERIEFVTLAPNEI